MCLPNMKNRELYFKIWTVLIFGLGLGASPWGHQCSFLQQTCFICSCMLSFISVHHALHFLLFPVLLFLCSIQITMAPNPSPKTRSAHSFLQTPHSEFYCNHRWLGTVRRCCKELEGTFLQVLLILLQNTNENILHSWMHLFINFYFTKLKQWISWSWSCLENKRMVASLFLTAGNTVCSFNTAISVVLSTGHRSIGLHRKLALKVGVGRPNFNVS